MNAHHLKVEQEDNLEDLVTLCVACHAVAHIGNNLRLGIIEIWRCEPLSQVEIVQLTREGIREGRSLLDIKEALPLEEPGHFAPGSTDWGDSLKDGMGSETWAYLPEPLCAVFVGLKRWQIDA
jgi:hypothetical protein